LDHAELKHKLLTNIYRADQIPATDSVRTTVCWRPLWILRP